MKGHLTAVVVLLLGLASHIADMTGLGLALFFIGAAIEMGLWLDAVQAPRRISAQLLARLDPRQSQRSTTSSYGTETRRH